MKLSEAAALCEANSRAFIDVYKVYNWKDDDDLHNYCDFILHETVEWMRGFPAAWKSEGLFTKPRAAFHRLLKQSAVLEELGAAYCEQVHRVIWGAYKSHMAAILEKRLGAAKNVVETATVLEMVTAEDDSDSDALTAESVDEIRPTPCKPVIPWGEVENYVEYKKSALDYKHKYEVVVGVLGTLLAAGPVGPAADENARLRAALATLLSEFGRA